jgi:hypothetical protein
LKRRWLQSGVMENGTVICRVGPQAKEALARFGPVMP